MRVRSWRRATMRQSTVARCVPKRLRRRRGMNYFECELMR
ncbi:hypothetical protein BJ970_006376 [Saccharopolyspora phatthalungensis]|uniref:Uncharacterized protein n=1 Tax=Saccharopolyspora phatthalungensis TaxID=664693 RepID=A0A840QFD3_9PSEU|nr:hypothetical protein [Saccharopolyspora phatthalungensis]